MLPDAFGVHFQGVLNVFDGSTVTLDSFDSEDGEWTPAGSTIILDNSTLSRAISGTSVFGGFFMFLTWQRDGGDLSLWIANYGNSASSANVGSVPEPASMLLFVLGGLAKAFLVVRMGRISCCVAVAT